MVMLSEMLRALAGSGSESGKSAPKGVNQITLSPGELPGALDQWPTEWHSRFKRTASTIKQLLPIDELYAEASAEIAVRCEYTRQFSERS